MGIFTNLTLLILIFIRKPYPLYPLPLIKGKGKTLKRGADAPLKHPTLLTQRKESQREASPLLHIIPPPFPREGYNGGGLLNPE